MDELPPGKGVTLLPDPPPRIDLHGNARLTHKGATELGKALWGGNTHGAGVA